MRQVTEKVASAFIRNEYKRVGNTWTDGQSIWLFSNKIAQKRGSELWITNAGWPSPTTKERLNALPNVSIVQKKGVWYLNGNAWYGEWVHVETFAVDHLTEPEFDLTSVWVAEGGYSKPVYAVWHSNNQIDLLEIEGVLSRLNIPSRRWESDTEGVYRPNYFVVVRPEDFSKVITTNQ
jgi:hypothetical protein